MGIARNSETSESMPVYDCLMKQRAIIRPSYLRPAGQTYSATRLPPGAVGTNEFGYPVDAQNNVLVQYSGSWQGGTPGPNGQIGWNAQSQPIDSSGNVIAAASTSYSVTNLPPGASGVNEFGYPVDAQGIVLVQYLGQWTGGTPGQGGVVGYNAQSQPIDNSGTVLSTTSQGSGSSASGSGGGASAPNFLAQKRQAGITPATGGSSSMSLLARLRPYAPLAIGIGAAAALVTIVVVVAKKNERAAAAA